MSDTFHYHDWDEDGEPIQGNQPNGNPSVPEDESEDESELQGHPF